MPQYRGKRMSGLLFALICLQFIQLIYFWIIAIYATGLKAEQYHRVYISKSTTSSSLDQYYQTTNQTITNLVKFTGFVLFIVFVFYLMILFMAVGQGTDVTAGYIVFVGVIELALFVMFSAFYYNRKDWLLWDGNTKTHFFGFASLMIVSVILSLVQLFASSPEFALHTMELGIAVALNSGNYGGGGVHYHYH